MEFAEKEDKKPHKSHDTRDFTVAASRVLNIHSILSNEPIRFLRFAYIHTYVRASSIQTFGFQMSCLLACLLNCSDFRTIFFFVPAVANSLFSRIFKTAYYLLHVLSSQSPPTVICSKATTIMFDEETSVLMQQANLDLSDHLSTGSHGSHHHHHHHHREKDATGANANASAKTKSDSSFSSRSIRRLSGKLMIFIASIHPRKATYTSRLGEIYIS